MQRILKKIDWLKNKKSRSIKAKIRPIYYSCSVSKRLNDTSSINQLTISNYSNNSVDSERIYINPSNFSQESALDTLHDKWFVNLSNFDVLQYLQLGEKFGLPINKYNKEKTLIEFIKHIENNLNGRPKNIINFVRNNSVPILNSFQNNFPSLKFTGKLNLQWLHVTKKFINNHQNDHLDQKVPGIHSENSKYKDVYISNMEVILSDTDTYRLIDKDPIKKLTQDLRALLVRWKCNRFIDEPTYRRLFTTDGVIPRAYGLTKIHKDGNPLCVIVSSINSPLYCLSLFLHNIINDKLNGTRFDSQYVLASLDVVSLFTNIPVDLAANSIDRRWDYISAKTSISKQEFIIAVSFVLDSTFFAFNNECEKTTTATIDGDSHVGEDLADNASDARAHSIPSIYKRKAELYKREKEMAERELALLRRELEVLRTDRDVSHAADRQVDDDDVTDAQDGRA
ncbi:hypothetical protein ALC60_13178 [Trachymyrmex zeteki]|uniref:Uncharacterized protein n=1 Tax=Mycetomoellerius zeteki TaxID=64791 RepID=A0A151WIU4_9HYME|nr:hypothetical protein ALC60_13178 [Trachymyrmex zeteki]